MSQRQHDSSNPFDRMEPDGPDAAGDGERLRAARERIAAVRATAERVRARLATSDSRAYVAENVQPGGQ